MLPTVMGMRPVLTCIHFSPVPTTLEVGTTTMNRTQKPGYRPDLSEQSSGSFVPLLRCSLRIWSGHSRADFLKRCRTRFDLAQVLCPIPQSKRARSRYWADYERKKISGKLGHSSASHPSHPKRLRK